MTDLRKPDYLSPSALGLFEKNPDEYFVRYIVPKHLRGKRDPQTGPQSVGSAFDALVKNQIHTTFYGAEETARSGYRLRDLLTQQCEDTTLPESLVIASQLWEEYIECGAFADLIADINNSSVTPRMEFEVTSTIGGVPLLGKPDLHYHTQLHAHVIADFKVSGACSDHGVSPQQGYMVARDVRKSSTHGLAHKKFVPSLHPGGLVVSGVPMNETTDYWADQLATYAWCLGEPVGSQDFIVRIEQLACRPNKDGLRVKCVTHQSTVSKGYQERLLERYQACWNAVENNHIWSDLSPAESQARGDLIIRSLSSSPEAATSATSEDVSDMDFSF